MSIVVNLLANDRSRRRTARTFAINYNASYANPGPNYIDLTAALDPNHVGAPVSGLIDPLDIAAGLYSPKIDDYPVNGFIVAGVQYVPILFMNPSATSWANALILVLQNAATGAQLANATTIVGGLTFDLVGPNGKF